MIQKCKSLFLFFLLLLISDEVVSDVFDSHTVDQLGLRQKIHNSTVTIPLDFNGDSYLDILLDDMTVTKNLRGNFYLPLNQQEPKYFYGIRASVVFEINKMNPNNHLIAVSVLPPISNQDGYPQNDSLALIMNGGTMIVVRYLNDDATLIFDRYSVYEYIFDVKGQDTSSLFYDVLYVGFGDVSIEPSVWNDDLLVVASDGTQTRLFLFEKPFDGFQNTIQSLSPTEIYSMPCKPECFWIGDIDGSKEDLFFACDYFWYIWLSNRPRSFSPDSDLYSFVVSIPEGVVQSIDFFSRTDDYSFLVSVESERDSDIAYVAFPADNLGQPVSVTLPDKHLQGTTTRMFTYQESTGESYPLLIVYDPLDDDSPQSNTYYIYRIDVNDPLSPKLVQTFTPEYSTEDYQYFFDSPAEVADFDHDGVSDILFMAKGIPTVNSIQTDVSYRFIGFMGTTSETPVTDWSVNE